MDKANYYKNMRLSTTLALIALTVSLFFVSCGGDEEDNLIMHTTNDLYGVTQFEADGIKYYADTETGQASVWTNYTSSLSSAYTGSITIPETVEYEGTTYTVTTIGISAFAGSSITDITIPQTVTTFGYGAFKNCFNLSEFTIADQVTTIGDYAFAYCYNLTDVTVGSGVNTIGAYAFSEYPRDYYDEDGKNVYGVSGSLKNIEWKGVVDSLGDYAFEYCRGLKELSIPCKYIGSYAFQNCSSLMEVTLESSVERMGDNVFSGCTNLMEATIASKTVGAYAFSKCTALIEAVIKDGVEAIGDYAFNGCSKMTSITFPSSITSISEGAFYDSALTMVTIPSSVTSIGNLAFYCNLTEYDVAQDNSYYCAKDGVLYSKDMKTVVQCPKAYDAFDTYELPSTITTIGDYAFYGCTKVSKMTIPQSISTINDHAFASSKINGVVLDCLSIGTYAFDGCTNLSEVTFADHVRDIDAYAFSGCTSVKELSLNGVAVIGDNAFQSCTHLSSVDTGNAVTTIGECAFNKCSALAEVTIGTSVSNIGTSAFEECGNLTSITSLNATPPSCDSYAFLGVSKSSCTIYVPKGAKSAYTSAATWQDFSNIVEME